MATNSNLLSSFSAHAECPRLEGTFHCRARPAFDVQIIQGSNSGIPTYTMTDPSNSQTFLVDGQIHEMEFQEGRGMYVASCQGNRLIINANSPSGKIIKDRYYIERAGLVRVRTSHGHASSLSCAPTQGTWQLYPH